jgi:hypothetical protein
MTKVTKFSRIGSDRIFTTVRLAQGFLPLLLRDAGTYDVSSLDWEEP